MVGRLMAMLLLVAGLQSGIEGDNNVHLDYACKPNGDISVRILASLAKKYTYVFAGNQSCDSVYDPKVYNATGGFVPTNETNVNYAEGTYRFLSITDCANSLTEHVIVLVSYKSIGTTIIGGKSQKPYEISCRLMADPRLSQMNVNASTFFSSSVGYDSIVTQYPDIDISMKNLLGETGFNVFTIGYPIYTEFQGPPTTTFRPSMCIAYNLLGTKSKTITINGCSLAPKLMSSFSENATDWTSKPAVDIADHDDEDLLLAAEGYGEEGAAAVVRPMLWTDIMAFRFRGSKQTLVHCTFTVCPGEEDDECIITCQTTTASTTLGATTAATTTLGATTVATTLEAGSTTTTVISTTTDSDFP